MTRNLNADDIKRGAEIKWTETTLVVEEEYGGVVVELFEEEVDLASNPPESDKERFPTEMRTRVRLEDEDGEEFTTPIESFTDPGEGVTIDEFEPAEETEHTCDECGRDDFDSEHGVAVHKGLAHAEDEEEEAELVADGGEPTADEEFSDSDIQTAIDDNGAETDVEEVRETLRMIQKSVEEVWDLHMDSVEENALELVAMDDDVVVFADHTNQFWNEEFRNGPVAEADLPAGMQRVVSQLQHGWARRRSGYDWGVSDPVVVRKPQEFDAARRLVEAVMLNLTSRGLSPRQAWAVWGVLAGNSRNNWAARMGYDSHSGVSNAVREAQEKLPLQYIG